jgi:hypothetical protein
MIGQSLPGSEVRPAGHLTARQPSIIANPNAAGSGRLRARFLAMLALSAGSAMITRAVKHSYGKLRSKLPEKKNSDLCAQGAGIGEAY